MSEDKLSLVLEVKERFKQAFDNFNKGIDTAGKYAQDFGKKVGDVKDKMAGLQGTIQNTVGAFGGFAVLKGSYDEFQKNEQALLKLNRAFDNSQGAIGLTRKELMALRDDVDAKTLFGGDDLAEAQAKLISFGTIGGDVFKRTTQTMADFATFSKTDLTSAANLLGKALSNPAEAFGLLSKQGVNFTDAQEKMLKKMVETGDIASAQNVILDALDGKYKGFAETAASGSGQVGLLKEKMEEFAEELGRLIAEFLVPVATFIRETILPIFENWKTEIAIFTGVLAGLAVAWGAVNAAMMFLNPVTLTIVAIGAAVVGVVKLVQNWSSIMDWLNDKWQVFKVYAELAWDVLTRFNLPLQAFMWFLSNSFEIAEKLFTYLMGATDGWGSKIGGWIDWASGKFASLGSWVLEKVIIPIGEGIASIFGSVFSESIDKAKVKLQELRDAQAQKEEEARQKKLQEEDKATQQEVDEKTKAQTAYQENLKKINQGQTDKKSSEALQKEKDEAEKRRKSAAQKEEDEIKKKYGFLTKEDRKYLKDKEKDDQTKARLDIQASRETYTRMSKEEEQFYKESKVFKDRQEKKEDRENQIKMRRKMKLTETMSSKSADAVIAEEQRVADEKEAQETRKWMIENNIGNARLVAAQDFLGQMAQLQSIKSREMFEVGKAFAIGEAIMNTYTGITKTLATYPFPISAAMAAAQAALGFAQVQQISSSAPAFERGGGFFGGAVGATTGRDNMMAEVRTGEMYLNARQQRNLFSRIDSDDLGTKSNPSQVNNYNYNVRINGNGDKSLKKMVEKTIENKEKRKLQKQQFVKGRFAT